MKNYHLPHSSPETQGISSEVVYRWVKAMDSLCHPHSFMLARNGYIISEGWWKPYNPETRHQLFSLSKSFVSMAIGLALDEGLLSLNNNIVDFFSDRVTEKSFDKMTIRHLLTMTSGHESCTLMPNLCSNDYVSSFFNTPLIYEPGSHFVYNSGCSYLLSAIISKITGEKLVDYLKPRLLEPLGIYDACWDECSRGINIGGWGFYLNTEEILNFGQFLQNRGEWNGIQLISKEYIESAVSYQADTSTNTKPDWRLGYGFHFWQGQHNSFRADGACGQYALVMPDYNLTLAVTGGMTNMQSILSLVWDILLDGIGSAKLKANYAFHNKLDVYCSELSIPILTLHSTSTDIISCTCTMKEHSSGIEQIEFNFTKEECSITFVRENESEEIRAGFCKNIYGIEHMYYGVPRKVAASAIWASSTELKIQCCYYETPFIVTFSFQFNKSILLESTSNIKFCSEDWEQMESELIQSLVLR